MTTLHLGDVFCHFRQVQGGKTTLNIGENVTYSLGSNPITGKVAAENVIGDGTGTPPISTGQFPGNYFLNMSFCGGREGFFIVK